MIISILDTAFTAAKSNDFNYSSGPIWELNQNDSPDKPLVHFNTDMPTHWKFTDQKFGFEKGVIVCQLFFIKYHPVSDTQIQRTVIIDQMHDALKAFKKIFESNATINPVNFDVDIDSANNWLDVNYAGISVVMKFETTNMPC